MADGADKSPGWRPRNRNKEIKFLPKTLFYSVLDENIRIFYLLGNPKITDIFILLT